MQVILIEDVKSLGKKGTLVNINDSYARNYVIPRKLGVAASAANLNTLKLQNANAVKLEAAKLANAKDVKAVIDGKTVKIKVKSGQDGKIFGAVTSKEVGEAINTAFKVEVDKKKIDMDPIKSLGQNKVLVKLHREVSAEIIVDIIGE